MKLEDLKQPIPHKWKIQSFNRDKTKGSCVAYIDARDAMDLLDKVCGPENWQDKFEVVGERFVCGIGIRPDKEWIWKFDTGVKAEREAEKSEFSDAFKRAGVKWGIGRFLYDLKVRWIDCKPEGNTAYPIDGNGNRIYDLTEFFEANPRQPATKETKQTETKKTGLEVFCPRCNAKMVEKSGTKDGRAYHGYFCPNSTKEDQHPPKWL